MSSVLAAFIPQTPFYQSRTPPLPCVWTESPRSAVGPSATPVRCAISYSATPVPREGSPADSFYYLTRPKPVLFFRRPLARSLAVLLLATSYDVVDQLDICPMDLFQKRFFSIRQHEWSRHLSDSPNIPQGDLSDPRYFDFISCIQLLTISEIVASTAPRVPLRLSSSSVTPHLPPVFIEAYNARGDTRIIRRDTASLPDPPAIRAMYTRNLGDRLYAHILHVYGKPPALPLPTLPALRDAVATLLIWLYQGGYCVREPQLDLRTGEGGAGELRVELNGPVTLWANQVLRQRGGMRNDYDVYIVEAFLRAADCPVTRDTRTSVTKESLLRTFYVHV